MYITYVINKHAIILLIDIYMARSGASWVCGVITRRIAFAIEVNL